MAGTSRSGRPKAGEKPPGRRPNLVVRVDQEDLDRLREAAERDKVSVSDVVRRAIQRELARLLRQR